MIMCVIDYRGLDNHGVRSIFIRKLKSAMSEAYDNSKSYHLKCYLYYLYIRVTKRKWLGGFECYIISEADGDAAAAEVYKSEVEGEGEGENAEESLLSVSPGGNVLSLVMRDQGIMR